jgi:ubiquinone/menaquinone biosynthesis C-methylase UbiE
MTLQRDPARNESKYLHTFADFAGQRVLEVGCGEGRLTWQYGQDAQLTIGIDQDLDALRVARLDRPSDLEHTALFACAESEYLPFSKETFGLTLLAWSF